MRHDYSKFNYCFNCDPTRKFTKDILRCLFCHQKVRTGAFNKHQTNTRYIRSEKQRVTLFLIIVHDYTSEAVAQAQKLKAFSEEDTDVALIKATDLKYVAEQWKNYSEQKDPEFNLQVFNMTGELTRSLLLSRMEWALKGVQNH